MFDIMKTTAAKLFSVFSDPNYFMIASTLSYFKIALGDYVFNDWQYLGFLTVLVTIDTILGTYKAIKNKSLESKAYGRVLEKVLLYASVLVVAHVMTRFTIAGRESGLLNWFDDLMLTAIMVREAISIMENIAEIKPDLLPTWLMKRFKKFDETGKLKDLINGDDE